MDDYWSGVAEDLIKQYWSLNLHIPVQVNGRLSKTLGTYEFKIKNGKVIPLRIQLSKELVQYGSRHFIYFILKHELCHFVLSHLGQPFKDKEDVFETELKRIGAFSSKKIRVLYRIQCTCCGEVFAFEGKKSAKEALKHSLCLCEVPSLIKYDVYYQKVDK